MRYYEAPVISGTTEQQIEQIKDYLFRQTADLNHNLKNTTAERFWQQTAQALSSYSDNTPAADSREELRRNEYNSLKALIIKSATAVLTTEDTFSQTLQGAYLAESDYGSFYEQGLLNVSGSPYTINQIYKYQTAVLNGVNSYKTELEGYINTGVLEKDSENPVFGIDIGYNRNIFEYNGKEYVNAHPSKIRITPNRIGFYNGSDNNGKAFEVAYISEKAVYFPLAHITGGTIKIGENFSVDEHGNMKATNADLTGSVKATAGYIGGFEITGSSNQNNQFWPCSIASIVTPTDGDVNDDYQYAVFLRGNYTESGKEYGAVTKEHNVFGIKKRAEAITTWQNESSPYVFKVSLKGNVYCNELEAEGRINGKYIKAHAERVALGQTGDDAYESPIELLTKGSINIGSNTIKPTEVIVTAGWFKSNATLIPYAKAAFSLGHINYPWEKTVTRSVTSDGNLYIGKTSLSDTFSNDVYIIGGNLYAGTDANPNTNAYLVASNIVRIGQNNENLVTSAVHIRGNEIHLTGTVYVNGKQI